MSFLKIVHYLISRLDRKKSKEWTKQNYCKAMYDRPKKILVNQKEIWSTKKIFGIPKNNLVDQKNEKLTGQLVYQRD